MKKRLISIFLAALMIMSLFAGCSNEPAKQTDPVIAETSAQTEPSVTEPPATESAAEPLDLESLYNQGMEVLAEMGDAAPILFPETNIDYLNEFYPGIADIEMKQFYAGVAPVTNAPFEIVLVEVANKDDVSTVMEIFQARMDRESTDATYPENGEAWLNNCKITSRGCYVFLAVLMDPCQIPAEFILD